MTCEPINSVSFVKIPTIACEIASGCATMKYWSLLSTKTYHSKDKVCPTQLCAIEKDNYLKMSLLESEIEYNFSLKCCFVGDMMVGKT